MQCLYCAKQLPLFKRLTKGEFCSNEHRQQYQLEYSQLALTRLLQAKPGGRSPQPEEGPSPDGVSKQAANGAPRSTPQAKTAAPPAPRPAPDAGPMLESQPAQDPAQYPAYNNGDPRIASPAADPRGAAAALAKSPSPASPHPKISMPLGPSQLAARNATLQSADTSVALAEPPELLAAPERVEPVEPGEPAELAEPVPAFTPEPGQTQETLLTTEPAAPNTAEDAESAEHLPQAESLPQKETEPEAIAPAAPAGPVEIRPSAASPKCASARRTEPEMLTVAPTEIPSAAIVPRIVVLDSAPRLSVFEIVHPAATLWRSRAGRLEIREFARTAPLLSLAAAIAAPRLDTAAQPAKLSFAPLLSRDGVTLWAESPRDFRTGQIELGEVAILDLPTTGFETSGIYESPVEPVESSREIPAPEEPIPTQQTAPPENMAAPGEEAPVEELRNELPEITATPAAEPAAVTALTANDIAAPVAIAEPTESEPAGVPDREADKTEVVAPLEFPEAAASVALEVTPAPSAEAVATPPAITPAPSESTLSEEPLPEANQIDAMPSAQTESEAISFVAAPVEESSAASESDAIPEPVGSSVAEASPAPSEVFAQAAESAPEAEPSTETTRAEQPLAEREPVRLTQPIPVVMAGIPAGKAKALQIFTATLKSEAVGQIPRYESLPLRPTMVLGRTDAPRPKQDPTKELARTAPPESAVAKPPSKPEPIPAEVRTSTEESKQREANSSRVASEKELAELNREHARLNREQAELNRARTEGNPKLVPAQAEVILRQIGPNRPLPGAELDLAEVNREQAKLNREQAELNRAQAELNREQARRNRELAKTAERIAAAVPAPAAQPATPVAGAPKTEPKPSLATPSAPEAASPIEDTDLGLPVLNLEAPKKRFPLWAMVASACAVILLVVILVFANRTPATPPEIPGASSLTAGAGAEWLENFSPDAKHPRTISVLRASQAWTDYSVDFSASVDVKALGWVFRAKDPANFYVARIEQDKTAGGLVGTFVYFPVINGIPQPRKRSSVTLPAAPGTIYNIRFEVAGDRFTAWIQDRKIEEWTDARLPSGGAGLYSESGERALLQGAFRVIPKSAPK